MRRKPEEIRRIRLDKKRLEREREKIKPEGDQAYPQFVDGPTSIDRFPPEFSDDIKNNPDLATCCHDTETHNCYRLVSQQQARAAEIRQVPDVPDVFVSICDKGHRHIRMLVGGLI